MVRWFNRHATVCYAVVLLPLWVKLTQLFWQDTIGIAGYYIPLLLACAAMVLLSGRCLARETAQSVEQYRLRCDPEPMEATCRELLACRRRWKRKNRFCLSLRLNLMTALCAKGDLAGALKLAADTEPLLQKRGGVLRGMGELNRASVELSLGHCAEAESRLRAAEEIIGALPEKAEKSRARESYLLAIHRCRLRLLRDGGSEALAEELTALLEQAECLSEQVILHWHLAGCVRSMGREELARPHLEFVADRGNRFAVRAQALALLEGLPWAKT